MMQNFGFGGFYLHWLFDGLIVFGFLALLVWTVKNLKKDQLLKVAVVTLIVGILGSALTVRSSMRGFKSMMGGFFNEEVK